MNNYKEVRAVYKDGESKSKPFQTLMQPTLFEATKDAAAEDGVSVNEYINQALREKIARDNTEPQTEQPVKAQTGDTSEICGLLRDILGEMRIIHLAVDGIRATNITAQIIKEDAVGDDFEDVEEVDEATDEQVAFEFGGSEVGEGESSVPAASRKEKIPRNKAYDEAGNELLSTYDAAEELHVTRETVGDLIRAKLLKAEKIKGYWKISREALRKYQRATRKALYEKKNVG